MVEVRATRTEGFKISLSARGQTFMADAAIADGGTDTAPTPHEILAGALASCTSMTVQMYADRKKWPLKTCDTVVRLMQTDTTPPKNLFDVSVSLIGELTAEQRERLFDIAHRCPVHRILAGPIEMKLTLSPSVDRAAESAGET